MKAKQIFFLFISSQLTFQFTLYEHSIGLTCTWKILTRKKNLCVVYVSCMHWCFQLYDHLKPINFICVLTLKWLQHLLSEAEENYTPQPRTACSKANLFVQIPFTDKAAHHRTGRFDKHKLHKNSNTVLCGLNAKLGGGHELKTLDIFRNV